MLHLPIFCAIYDGRKASVEKFSTFTPDIKAMCAHMVSQRAGTAAMESTGIYIDAIHTILRQNQLHSKVANPLLIKQMPGRKSDAREKMEGLAEAHYHEELRLVQTIPGISLVSAICIIAEIGVDMSAFGSSGRLCGWAGLRPRNDESAGKYKSRALTKGGRHLKLMLVQCAWGAARTKGSKFQETFGRLVVRKGEKKAIVAVARKLLVTVYTLLNNKEEYCPEKTGKRPSGDQLARQLRYHVRQCERLGRLLPATEETSASDDLNKSNNEKAVYFCGSARPNRT